MAASIKDMSAQHAQQAPVRLLIAERTENAAHQFDSLLRDAGIATRLEIIELPMALDKLPNADLMLCNASLPELHQFLPRLNSIAPRVPIIIVNNAEASLSQTDGMELGAADVVSDADDQHLVLVAKRELEHVGQNLALDQTRKALDEAEQRCQLLLQSSRAAIAYVHEGMHIYANEGYLRLFGFEDADDLLGLPLIDLLDKDSSTTLKDSLKRFRTSEEETNFDFAGHSTAGAGISGNITLAPAEYEGEHCLQVTVRAEVTNVDPEISSEPETTETEVSQGPEGDVPVLRNDAIIESDSEAGSVEFKLELEDEAAGSTQSDDGPDDQPAAEPSSAEVLVFTGTAKDPDAQAQTAA